MRHSFTHSGVRATVGATMALSLVVAGFAPASHAVVGGPGGPSPAAAAAAAGSFSIPLITGDTLHITNVEDDRRTVELELGAGREGVTVHQMEIDGELVVLPLDALPYVASGRLDQDLFNVDVLLAAGFGAADFSALPLIAAYDDGEMRTASSALSAVEGVAPGVELSSINAQALDVEAADAGGFWSAITGVPADEAKLFATQDAKPAFTSAIEKVWLDAPVFATLDESTTQIGAPTAWEAGIDGSGTTVAVLDTGVDAAHPDLAGQVALQEDFSGSGNIGDHVGHGTHVAATAAGSGAASDGLRKGVAPGATIISGKVLGDDGSGDSSGVIAGMEWAVAQDADVINMSLGGGATDGTDPMSEALNVMSAESDSLFVVAAGNEGPGASTIGSPGSADAALTVGAVDRDESLASFSSRGPRLNDLAVKPDLTAPGVGIVAARAAGTALGSPVDDLYTAANGTSMATPHVAGAAALLASQHPEWDGEQLKNALISTAVANPSLTTYEQGAGRVDVTTAVTHDLTSTGSLHLGTFEDQDTESRTAEVTYVNSGTDDLSVELELAISTAAGDTPGEGAVTLSAESVSVPAGETATVTINVDPTLLDRGQYVGELRAKAGDAEVHTTLAVIKVAPTHEVTFRGVGFEGEPIFVTPIVLLGEDPRFDSIGFVKPGETVTFTVGEGDYFLHAMITPEIDGIDAAVVVTDPDLEVAGDLDIVLDARDATQVQIETPEPATTRGNLGFNTYREFYGRTLSNGTMKFDVTQSVWVTPTEKAKGGVFEFSSRWQMGTPMLTGKSVGRGSIEVYPRYERMSPALESKRPLELVYAGAGTPEDYQGLNVKGKIVVVSVESKGNEDVEAAAAAGASGLMIAAGTQWWTKFTGRGERLALPVMVLDPSDRDAVLEQLDSERKVRMRFEGSQDRPVTYDIMQVSSGQVPEKVVHKVSAKNSATITASYHEAGGEEWAKEQRFAWRPWQRSAIIETQNELHTPQKRTEIVSSGDTLWRQHVLDNYSWDSVSPITDGASHTTRTYESREKVSYDWHQAVVRPAIAPDKAPVRTGDTLSLRIPELAVGIGTLSQRSFSADTKMSLSQDGKLLHEDDAAWGDYAVGAGEIELDLSVVRTENQHWDFSTRTDTSWTFDSQGTGEDAETQPLLSIDYDVPVGLDNTVRAGKKEKIGLSVSHPDGLDRPAKLREVKVWVSYDDGKSWEKVKARSAGKDDFSVKISHPRRADYVSLRVEATDKDGNSITQTVVRAYGITAR